MNDTNHTLLNEIKKINFHLLHLGHATLSPKWRGVPHIINRDLFYMIMEGEADLWCNKKHILMTPGNIYVIPAGTLYNGICSKYCQKMYFHCNLFNSNQERITIAPTGCIILPDRMEQIQRIYELYQNTDYPSALTLRMIAQQLVLEVMQQTKTCAPIITYSKTVRQIIHRIIDEPHMSLTASSLAKHYGISTSGLHRMFSKEVGTSVGDYVRSRVLSAAEADLRDRSLSIKDISDKYGFCDQFYFSRLFSRRFGISPSKYRKNNIF